MKQERKNDQVPDEPPFFFVSLLFNRSRARIPQLGILERGQKRKNVFFSSSFHKMAANFWVSSQYEEWTKGQSFDKLNEEDQKRVSERKRKDAEIFGPDSMEEDIKRLRVHLANTITCGCPSPAHYNLRSHVFHLPPLSLKSTDYLLVLLPCLHLHLYQHFFARSCFALQ